MKILKITLSALLGVEALWVLTSLVMRTIDKGWHHPPLHGVLFVGLPLALLVAAILQATRPGPAFLLRAVLFPLATVISVMNFLPLWKFVGHLPRAWQGPACIVQNAVVVLISLAIWLETRKKIHNITLEASVASALQPQG